MAGRICSGCAVVETFCCLSILSLFSLTDINEMLWLHFFFFCGNKHKQKLAYFNVIELGCLSCTGTQKAFAFLANLSQADSE